MKPNKPEGSISPTQFNLLSFLVIALSVGLGIWLVVSDFQRSVNQQFDSLMIKLNHELNGVLSLKQGVISNILAQNALQEDDNLSTQVYLSSLSKEYDYLTFYFLPKITSDQIPSFEQSKQTQGYLSYRVFSNTDTDNWQNESIHFPIGDVHGDLTLSVMHLGRDVYSFPLFKEAIDQAIKQNTISAGWAHRSVDNPHGIALFMPIYNTNFIEQVKSDQRMNHVERIISTEIQLEKIILELDQRTLDQAIPHKITIISPTSESQWLSSELTSEGFLDIDYVLNPTEMTRRVNLLDKQITINLLAQPKWSSLNFFPLYTSVLLALFCLVMIQLANRWLLKQTHKQLNSEKTLTTERDQAKHTLNSLGEGVITTNNLGQIQYMNPKACEIFSVQWQPNQAVALKSLFSDVPTSDRDLVCNHLKESMQLTELKRLHSVRFINHHGDTILLDITVTPLATENQEQSGATLLIEDVTHLEEMRLQIERMAKFDHLTGLYNRYEFEHQLKSAILSAHQSGQQHAFCYLDLDQFKVVNDTAGHMAGDQLLRQLTTSIFMVNLPDGAVVGRLGGDEFGLIIFNTQLEQAIAVCNQIIEDIRAFIFIWQGRRFQIGVSIGLVLIDQQKLSVERCLIAADTACYLAKEKGRNRVEYASPDNSEINQRQEELSWVERIPRTIESGRMMLFIQRMLPLNQGARHAEVLVRMRDEQSETLLPAQFIVAAERYGIMEQIDRWVVSTALSNITQIHQSGSNDKTIYSINLSGQSLANENFMVFMLEELDKHHDIMPFVCFEITETALMNNLNQAINCMHQIKKKGASLALDDFGSGLSSYNYLRIMPIDYLKIDGAFVKNMHEDKINREIVANIHQLSRVFNVQTVAEFVDNKSIINELRLIGVDFAQGFGVHKPERWLI